MILLDTNVISELMKKQGNHKVIAWVDSFPPRQVFISSISKAEIEFGIRILPSGKKRNQLAEAASLALNAFKGCILPFNANSTLAFATIKALRKNIGKPISYADAQIAAIAIQHELQLATRNTVDFEYIEDLSIVNPWDV